MLRSPFTVERQSRVRWEGIGFDFGFGLGFGLSSWHSATLLQLISLLVRVKFASLRWRSFRGYVL